LASNFLSLLASLASVFFPPLSESFSPANWVLFLPDSEIQTHTWHGDLLISMTHTHTVMMVYFLVGFSTDKVHIVLCSAKTWFWRVFLWFGE
jgi:hypothetical protein